MALPERLLPFPEPFLERLPALVPEERLDAVYDAFLAPRDAGFRINTLRAEPEAVVAHLKAEGRTLFGIPWIADAFRVPAHERSALLASEAYARGWIYPQNPASMIPVEALAPEPGERVLDLAAAPGSKTLQIVCRMRDTGEVAAVEAVKSRFFRLRANLEAQGATCVRTFLRDGATVWRHRPEHFDRVLLDAPCSSEGRFHTSDPESYAYWSPRKIKEMTRKQRRLLFSAVQSLRPGGVLVYATCSLAPEENEAAVSRLLKTFGDALRVEPLGLPLDDALPPLESWRGKRFDARLAPARRILPSTVTEGFFVCRLRKLTSTLR